MNKIANNIIYLTSQKLNVFLITSSSGSKVMVSMSTGDSSGTKKGSERSGKETDHGFNHFPHTSYNAKVVSPVEGACKESTSPLRLFLLVSSSPDSSDSPLLSTLNHKVMNNNE